MVTLLKSDVYHMLPISHVYIKVKIKFCLQMFVNLHFLISFVHTSREHKVRKKWSKLHHDELHSVTVGAGLNQNSKLAQSDDKG